MKKFRMAVVCDSTGSHNNGWAIGSWVDDFGVLVDSGGVHDWEIDNFSVPGLRWETAHIPTPGFLIGGRLSPVDAIKAEGPYDLIVVSLGVNSRTDALDDQIAACKAFRASLPATTVAFVGQHYLLPDGRVSAKCAVTLDEAHKLEAVYATLPDKFYGAGFGMLHEMDFSYDLELHHTNSGKQMIAASFYIGMQADYPLTPINPERNIRGLYALFLHPPGSPERMQYEQMRKVNT